MLLPTKIISSGLILLVFFLSGCAVDEIYRSKFSLCEVSTSQNCEKFSIQHQNKATDSEYILGFVEVDDQGQLRDRQQLQSLLDTLYVLAAKDSLLINVFVHGWHHNAGPGDSNVQSFKSSMARLSQVEGKLSASKNKIPRKIVGIYVGWRGESITTPVLNNLTFWERKNAAQKVGYLGLTELLLKLEEISNVKNTQEPPIKSRLVVVGHSFGGAAVYSATSQILASRFIDSRENKNFSGDADGFGDLVVLLNPAFEALSYAPLYDMAQSRCSYFASQRPRFVVLTSEADYATKLAFPAGRLFSSVFETHSTLSRRYCNRDLTLDEGAADRHTVGHFEPLLSHSLKLADKNASLQVAQFDTIGNIWSTQTEHESTQIAGTVLTHLGKTAPRNPFLNVKVDKELIADHNDVFGDEIMEFLRMLIVLSTGE